MAAAKRGSSPLKPRGASIPSKLSLLKLGMQMKKMLREWERERPGRLDNMATALANVVPSHLQDRNLFGFTDSEGAVVFAGEQAPAQAQA